MTDAYRARRAAAMEAWPYAVSRYYKDDGKWRYHDRTDNPEEYVRRYRKNHDPECTTKLRITHSKTRKVVYQDKI